MKKFNLVLFFSLLLNVALSQTATERGKWTNTCMNFRTGTFYSVIPGNGYCVRNDSVARMYYYSDTTKYYEFSIKWLSDCEMKMEFLKSNDPNATSRAGDAFFVNLNPIDPTTYTYKMKLVNKRYPNGYTYATASSSTDKSKLVLEKK